MIISRAKLDDMKIRDLMLSVMEVAVRTGHLDIAKEIGEYSQQLATHITIHNYTKQDSFIKRLHGILNT